MSAEQAARSAPPRRRRRRRRRHLWVSGVAVFAALLAVAAVWVRRQVLEPAEPGAASSVVVAVRPGMGVREIASLLRQRGVLRSAWGFEVLTRLGGRGRDLQAGTYILGPGMTPRAILADLASGHLAVEVSVRIIEGWDARQVVAALAAAGLGGPDLATAVNNAQLLAAAGLPAPAPGARTALEGYLFPDTYSFPPEAGADTVFSTMLARFSRTWTPALAAAARANAGLDSQAAVTLASIVQREVSRPQDMQVVAGVYLNRLRRGMPLDADPTVLYGLGLEAQNGPLTDAELGLSSPYNTYRTAGLPPGPICNPGAAALQAVAHPATTSALYFLTAPSGQLILADTLAQQRINQQKYLGG